MMKKVWLLQENFQLLDQEKTYWHNRCHEEWLRDNNTKYFHRITNGRKRTNTIISLENNGSIIEGEENLLQHATEYYFSLFGPEDDHNIHIDSSLWESVEKVSESDNILLCTPFSETEIKEALFQMEKNKVAGPYKIPVEFYQTYWEVIKYDILQLFQDFCENKVDFCRINYVIITLLPKISNATKIQQHRPICLLNCLYKLITKTLSLRME